MCRLASFPPFFPREQALEILLDFESYNKDGIGSVYVKDNEFIVEKYPKSLSEILKNKVDFLSHMPYNGWTIAHLRAASHGKNTKNNTHPFIVDDWAVVHNGIWSEYNVVKLALEKTIDFKGETDSEVAAHLINMAGPERFSEEVTFGGVYLALNRDGSLYAIKTSGELSLFEWKNNKALLASELDLERYSGVSEALNGWYKFDKHGKFVKNKSVQEEFMKGFAQGKYDDEDIPSYMMDEDYYKTAFQYDGPILTIRPKSKRKTNFSNRSSLKSTVIYPKKFY